MAGLQRASGDDAKEYLVLPVTHAQCKAVSYLWCQHVLLGSQGNIQNIRTVKMTKLHMASGDDATEYYKKKKKKKNATEY